nr:hypothetical protein CFP56_53827 [Quercus suber]
MLLRADQGNNHHLAAVSTSFTVSSLILGAYGVPVVAGVTSTSISPSDNAIPLLLTLYPFVPSEVEVAPFSSVGTDSFVTPISILDLASIDYNDASPPPSSINPTSIDLTSLPFMPVDTSSSPSQVSKGARREEWFEIKMEHELAAFCEQ